MATEKNLRESLLQQESGSAHVAAELRDKILATDEARVRRMKWIAGISWVVFLILFPLAALIEIGRRYAGVTTGEVAALFPEYGWFAPLAIIITPALFIIATAMTVALYVHSRTLTMHQIQGRLAVIEEQLRKLAEKG